MYNIMNQINEIDLKQIKEMFNFYKSLQEVISLKKVYECKICSKNTKAKKKYSQSEKGRAKRREQNQRYYDKKKSKKINAN
jgi:hypothetical protein